MEYIFSILFLKNFNLFLKAPDPRTIVWRERARQNGNGSTSQYGTYYGRPSFESADETLDESEWIFLINSYLVFFLAFLVYEYLTKSMS
jgi:hypothetical protein